MHIHIYVHIHICAQPAVNVSKMCTLISKEHLYNIYSCACTGAQNTCSKVHTTFTAQKCTIIYTYTHMHMHTYPQEYTGASMTPSNHATAEEWLQQTHNLCTNLVCTHIHILKTKEFQTQLLHYFCKSDNKNNHHHCHHRYIHAYVYIYIYTCIYIHIYMSVHIHACTHTHTHTTCTYARMQTRLKQRCGSECAGSPT